MEIIFGTDGWRALLESEMNNTTVALAAQAFADYCAGNYNNKIIAIGFDGRKYSDKFASLFASVLSGNGIKAFLSEAITTTPSLSYYVKAHSLDAGVMITASHNPPQYNGVKFKASYGGPFLTEETHKVEELLGKSAVRQSSDNIQPVNMTAEYIEQIKRIIDFDVIKSSGVSILADSMAGAGAEIIESICNEFGIPCDTIFGCPASDFDGRLAEPIEKNLIPLRKELQSKKCYSLGVATDGDADRLGVLLDNGNWLSAQYTILLLADYLINTKKWKGNLVKTSSVTNKLKAFFESDNRNVYDVQVGFKYICEKMISDNIAFGCEESGGYGYQGHIPERDGILSAFLMAEMLANSGVTRLSEYFAIKEKEFGQIYYDRIDFEYKGNDRTEILPDLYSNPPAEINNFPVENISKFFSSRGIINGLKFTLKGKTRWLLLRSSETEPLVRIYAEGESSDEVKNFLNTGIKIITKQV
jgi:phosphomannomutase